MELRQLQKNNYHELKIDEVCEKFEVDPNKGLNYSQVTKRVIENGLNKLTPPPQGHGCSHILQFLLQPVICCGILLPIIFCIIIVALQPNISTIILMVLFIISFFILLWISLYGKQKFIDPYFIINDEKFSQVLRDYSHQKLIYGYYRTTLKQTPITDITELIEMYYRM